MFRITVSGYYGFDNLGDEAVLAGLIRSLRLAAGEIEITVLSNQPAATADIYGVKAAARSSWQAVYRTIARSDLLISGGGSLLQDVTSWRTVPFYLSQVLLAQLLGKKTIFYAQGVGPVRRKALQQLIRVVGKRTDLITVRDQGSRELLAAFGLKREQIMVTADPVFALPGPDGIRGRGGAEAGGGVKEEQNIAQPLLGVSVRPWEGNSYLPALAAAVDKLAGISGCRILIIPMHLKEDLPVSAGLQNLLKHDSVLLEESRTPEEMLDIYASLDYLIGVRLHSLIFAAHCQVPFTALSYDPKVRGFLEMLGLEQPLEISGLSAASLQESCRQGWLERERVRAVLQEKQEHFKEAALANGRMALQLLRN